MAIIKPYKFDIQLKASTNRQTGITLQQNSSALFEITIYDGDTFLNLNNSEYIKLRFVKSDNSILEKDITILDISNGKVSYLINNEITDLLGNVSMNFSISMSGSSENIYNSQYVTFNISNHGMVENPTIHRHSNLEILEKITEVDISKWNKKASHIHSNKNILDNITTNRVKKWDSDAIVQDHNIANYYMKGVIVYHNNALYRSKYDNIMGEFTDTEWEILSTNNNNGGSILTYNPLDDYNIGQLVEKNNIIYKAKENIIPSLFDETKWIKITMGEIAESTIGVYKYLEDNVYNTNMICLYNNELHSANENGITGSWNSSKWTPISSSDDKKTGIFKYSDTETYKIGDIVERNSHLYKALFDIAPQVWNEAKWQKITGNVEDLPIVGLYVFSESRNFKIGQVIMHDGYLYRCLNDNVIGVFNSSDWEELKSTKTERQYGIFLFNTNDTYKLGEIVEYNNSLFKCKQPSVSGNFDLNNWSPIVDSEEAILSGTFSGNGNATTIPTGLIITSSHAAFIQQIGLTNFGSIGEVTYEFVGNDILVYNSGVSGGTFKVIIK